MRIRTGSASSTIELAGYLRHCECIVEVRDDWTLEVTVRPGSLSAEHARIELDAYLSAWERMNPTASVERLGVALSPARAPIAAHSVLKPL